MNLLIVTSNFEQASFRQWIGIYLGILHDNGIKCEKAKLPSNSLERRKIFKRAADFYGVFLNNKDLNLFDAIRLHKYGESIVYNFDDAAMYNHKNPERYSRSHFIPYRIPLRLANMSDYRQFLSCRTCAKI